MNWYEFIGFQGHVGAGKFREIKLYIKAINMSEALNQYKMIPSVKQINSHTLPQIRKMEDEEIPDLENKINTDPDIKDPVHQWYYFDNTISSLS